MIKGMGIVLMVLRHARAPYSDFVLLFHMAIFFIASGYLYNCDYARSIKGMQKYIRKKIRTLYIPYILYTSIFIIFNNIFLKLNIYTDNVKFLEEKISQGYATLGTKYDLITIIKNILYAAVFRGGTQLTGASWFFQTLFMVLILYTIVEFFLCKLLQKDCVIKIQTFFAGFSLILGWICQIKGWYFFIGLNRVFTVYSLIHLGVLIKRYSIMEKILSRVKQEILFSGSLFILLCGYHRGYISLDGNNIENPIFFLVMSIAGWLMLYSIAIVAEKSDLKINEMLCYISRHSVPIIMLHFLAFKIVNYIIVCKEQMPSYMIAAFPVLKTTGLWWALYTLFGLIVPLLARQIGKRISLSKKFYLICKKNR